MDPSALSATQPGGSIEAHPLTTLNLATGIPAPSLVDGQPDYGRPVSLETRCLYESPVTADVIFSEYESFRYTDSLISVDDHIGEGMGQCSTLLDQGLIKYVVDVHS